MKKNIFAVFIIVLIIGVIFIVKSLVVQQNIKQNAEQVIAQMFYNMESLDAFSTEGEIIFEDEMFNLYDSLERFSLSFRQNFNKVDSVNSKSSTELTGNYYKKSGFPGQAIDVSFTLNTTAIGETFYFKLIGMKKALKSLPINLTIRLDLESIGFYLELIEDQWIKADEEGTKLLMLQESTEEEIEKEIKEKAEQREKMLRLLRDPKSYIIKKVLPEKMIANRKVYHYLIDFDRRRLKKELGELAAVIDIIPEIRAELFIDKETLYPYELKIEKKEKYEDKNVLLGWRKEFTLRLKFFDFNQPITIEPPTEYKRIEQLLIEFEELEEVVGWKTYKNAEYEFELKYPKNWLALENEECFYQFKENFKTVVHFKPETFQEGEKYICVDITPNKNRDSLKDYFAKQKANKNGHVGYFPFVDLNPIETVIVNNHNFYKIWIPGVTGSVHFFTAYNQNILNIYSYEGKEDFFEIQEKIISTFNPI